jgi:hypothetical protein
MIRIANELRALTRPAFNLTGHLARSAEQHSWKLTEHLRARQPINVLHTTCNRLRRPLEDR